MMRDHPGARRLAARRFGARIGAALLAALAIGAAAFAEEEAADQCEALKNQAPPEIFEPGDTDVRIRLRGRAVAEMYLQYLLAFYEYGAPVPFKVVDFESRGASPICQCYDEAFKSAATGIGVLSTEFRAGFDYCRGGLGSAGGEAWVAGWNNRLSGGAKGCVFYRDSKALCNIYKDVLGLPGCPAERFDELVEKTHYKPTQSQATIPDLPLSEYSYFQTFARGDPAQRSILEKFEGALYADRIVQRFENSEQNAVTLEIKGYEFKLRSLSEKALARVRCAVQKANWSSYAYDYLEEKAARDGKGAADGALAILQPSAIRMDERRMAVAEPRHAAPLRRPLYRQAAAGKNGALQPAKSIYDLLPEDKRPLRSCPCEGEACPLIVLLDQKADENHPALRSSSVTLTADNRLVPAGDGHAAAAPRNRCEPSRAFDKTRDHGTHLAGVMTGSGENSCYAGAAAGAAQLLSLNYTGTDRNALLDQFLNRHWAPTTRSDLQNRFQIYVAATEFPVQEEENLPGGGWREARDRLHKPAPIRKLNDGGGLKPLVVVAAGHAPDGGRGIEIARTKRIAPQSLGD
ncbi:MAG: hypothetical protein AB7P23_13120, partial [Amphiplicatus sp.]